MRLFTFILGLIFFETASSQVTLNLKLYIEGYYTGNSLMDNYGSGGCLFINGISTNPNDADTITVSLARTNDLSIADMAKGILQTDGSLSVSFPLINPGSAYFLRISHRNALRTWSSVPVTMQPVTYYDFSDSSSKAAGNNMMRSWDTQVWMFYSGDISGAIVTGLGLCYQDGIIESSDYIYMLNAVSAILQGYICQDITGDGIVQADDWLIVDNATAAIRYEIPPAPVDIAEINYDKNQPNIFKCLIIDGKILTDFTNLPDVYFSIYNLSGQKIFKTTKRELLNSGNIKIRNGFYILKVND